MAPDAGRAEKVPVRNELRVRSLDGRGTNAHGLCSSANFLRRARLDSAQLYRWRSKARTLLDCTGARDASVSRSSSTSSIASADAFSFVPEGMSADLSGNRSVSFSCSHQPIF